MKSKFSLSIILFTMALFFSGLSFFLLWREISYINTQEFTLEYPKSQLAIFMLLSRSSFILTPFLLAISIIGTFLISRFWMKNVIINVMNENYNKQYVVNRIKHLNDEEKIILNILINKKSEILQSDLVKESKLSAYKVTRILNRFEERELIKREKYGITNVIYLLFDPENQIVS